MIEASKGKNRENGILWENSVIQLGGVNLNCLNILNTILNEANQPLINPLIPPESLTLTQIKKLIEPRINNGRFWFCIPAKQMGKGQIAFDITLDIADSNSGVKQWDFLVEKPKDYNPEPKNVCDNQQTTIIGLDIKDSDGIGSDSIKLVKTEDIFNGQKIRLQGVSVKFPDRLISYQQGLRGVCVNPQRKTATICFEDQNGNPAYATFRRDKSQVKLLFAVSN